uniref:Uncharacterized protein n=1 Tax=viral metagenome TaxID=1070528 RepID=A0A6M3LV96_9ZZZZ
MWQFLCDSAYDLFHLHDRYGQKTLRGWWVTRKFEWKYLTKP